MNNFNLKQFYYFDELSSEAKQQARINVMVPEQAARDEKLSLWRLFISMAKVNALKQKQGYKVAADAPTIHTLINDRLHHRRLVNGSTAIYKVKAQGDKYLIPFIRQNLTIFTDKGDYVYYGSNAVEIISNGEVCHLNSHEDKLLARQAYIDVNDRGPAYHDKLYRTWHRIKHFMIVNNKG